MAHGDGDLQRVGQGLQAHLPQTTPGTVTPSTVGQDQQGIRAGVPHLAFRLPPQSDALHCEVRGVMAGSHIDEPTVVSHVIDPVRTALPTLIDGKSWICTRIGCPFGCQVRPAFLKSPTSSFFLVSTEMTGWPRSRNARARLFR